MSKISYPPPHLTMNAELLQWSKYSKSLAGLWKFPSLEGEFSQLRGQLQMRIQACQLAWEPLVDGGVRSLGRSIFLKQWQEKRDSILPVPPFQAPTYLHALANLGRFTLSGLLEASKGGVSKGLSTKVTVTWDHFFFSDLYHREIADWLSAHQKKVGYQEIGMEGEKEISQMLDPASDVLRRAKFRRSWGKKYLEEREYDDTAYIILHALFVCGSLQQKAMPSQLKTLFDVEVSLDIIGAYINDLVLLHLVSNAGDYQLTYLGRAQYMEWKPFGPLEPMK